MLRVLVLDVDQGHNRDVGPEMVDGPSHGVRAVLVLVDGHGHRGGARGGGTVVGRQLRRGHLADRRAGDGAAAAVAAAGVGPISSWGGGAAPGVAAEAPGGELVWEKRLTNEVKAHCACGLRGLSRFFSLTDIGDINELYLICAPSFRPIFGSLTRSLFTGWIID